ncbi:YafY family protein [Corynebacterium sp.]|uniref:helix-turn-helix transcriptional regulator n=1 Tax=Corynebacterium sp. TaxID=1720 RepID=UPI0026E0C820|nr:WYL domain-containing protein [Corynebacterium sp.]MDO5511148.1 WYL domain-containing protein [Corynebacterium sp.]
MATQEKTVERLLNLVFALQDADRQGVGMLTPEWIRTHVNGYRDGTRDAFLRRLNRDIATLGRAGVPLEQRSSDTGGATFRLLTDRYELPAVSFTPEEAAVLGLAGQMGQSSELGVFARSGWTKLAAAGVSRDLSQAPVFTAVNDTHRLAPEILGNILTIIRKGYRMSFDYVSTPTSEPVRRTMDPWAIVNHQDKLFLIGHDIDRDAPRCFRVLRIAKVYAKHQKITHPRPEDDLQDIVVESLRALHSRVDAVLTIPEDTAHELAAVGTRRDDGLTELIDVDRAWLARTAAGFAPDVIVHEPADVRDDVIALLKGARS